MTSKEEPGDFDAAGTRTVLISTPLIRSSLDLSAGRAAQKSRYGGDLFPNVIEAQTSGSRRTITVEI